MVTSLPVPGVTPPNWGAQLNAAIQSRYTENKNAVETETTERQDADDDLGDRLDTVESELAAMSDAETAVARLDRQDASARAAAGGAASIQYADGTEHVEDWADLTGVLPVANAQVSGNRFYAINNTAPGGWNKEYVLPLAEKWRVSTLLYFKAGGAASTYFGINCGVAGKVLVQNDPDSIVIGISSSNVRTVVLGSNLTGINLSNQGTLGANPTTDQTYLVTVEADDEDVSFTIKNVADIDDMVVWSFEKASLTGLGKTVNNLTCYLTDARGTAGNGFAPFIVTTGSLQPHRTKTVAGQLIQGVAPDIRRRSSGIISSSNAQIIGLPDDYDPRRPSPLVLWAHQSLTGSAWDPWEETRVQPVTQLLQDNGFIVAGVNDPVAGVASFGNSASLSEYLDLYNFLADNYNIGPLFWYGASMGGLDIANTISQRVFPTPAAAACVGGAWDLGYIWDLGAPYTALVEAAYGASGRADLLNKSVGFDPIRAAGTQFRGVPWRLYTSAGDTIQPPANQQAFLDIVEPYAPEAVLVTATGGHLDPSQYQPSDVLAFFNRYR